VSVQQALTRSSKRPLRSRLRPLPAPHCARCARLEHLLHEELGQELTGITLMLTAARRAPASAPGLDTALANITGLLARAIGRCRHNPAGA
jgi:hypothetical protein